MIEIAFGRAMDLLPRDVSPDGALFFTSILKSRDDQLFEVVGTPVKIICTAVLEVEFGGSI